MHNTYKYIKAQYNITIPVLLRVRVVDREMGGCMMGDVSITIVSLRDLSPPVLLYKHDLYYTYIHTYTYLTMSSHRCMLALFLLLGLRTTYIINPRRACAGGLR